MRLLFAAAVLIVGVALGAPGAIASSVSTPSGHQAEDAVVQSPAQEQKLGKHTLTATAADAKAAAASVTDNPHDVGSWGPVVPWPVVAIHEALLPNGKVLAYDSAGDNATESYSVHDHARATVFDPVTGSQLDVEEQGFNIFCSGLTHLFDGRMFFAGGNLDPAFDGIKETHFFDPATNTWSLGPDMRAGRWYPTVTPLRNGEMLITSGYDIAPNTNDIPEVYTPQTNSIRELNGATVPLPLYPWIDLAPDGHPFDFGPDPSMRRFDTTGDGAWHYVADRDQINRDYGSHALFDIGKELVSGGGPSTRTAEVIDMNKPTPTVTPTGSMAFGRRQHNLTVLADGSVLATGGYSSGLTVSPLVDLNSGVYNAELWNPNTGNWSTLAAEQVTRQYHSSALLLPDATVLVAGGGVCGICDQVGYLAKNSETFSPPYLFQPDGTPAPRPSIGFAPGSTLYGARFDIETPDAQSIKKVALIRLGAVTHSNNMEQRYIPLSFSADTNSLTATAPSNSNIAPPGIYMLFIINADGVPSVAKMVGVGNSPMDETAPSVAGVTPTSGATGVDLGASVTATFSESIDPATATTSSFTLKDGNGNSVAATVSTSGSDVTLNPSAPLAPNKTYTATLQGGSGGIEDRAGNALDTGSSLELDHTWSFTTRAARPTASFTSPSANQTVYGTIDVAATAGEEQGGPGIWLTAFRLDDPSSDPISMDYSSPYGFKLDTTKLTDGQHTLYVRAADQAGNVSPDDSVTFNVDNAHAPPPADPPPDPGPVTTITSPGANATVSGTIDVTANAQDKSGSGMWLTALRVDDPSALAVDVDYSNPWDLRLDTRRLPDGQHTLYVRGADWAGNVGQDATVTINVDNADAPPPNPGPIASFTNPLANQVVSGTVDVAATIQDQSGAGLWLAAFRIDDPSSSAFAIDYSNPWGFSLDTTQLSNGIHTLYVRAEDNVLNVGADATVTFYVDNSAPGSDLGPITSFATPGAGQTVNGTIDVAATAQDQSGSGIWLTAFRLDNQRSDPVNIDYSSPYGFSLDTTTLADGQHTLYVRSSDYAGHVGHDATVTFNVDNAHAPPPGDPPPNPGPITSFTTPVANQTVSGTVDVGATAQDQSGTGIWLTAFRVDNQSSDAVAVDYSSPYGFSLDTTKLADGPHTLFVRGADYAGHTGRDATVTFNVDNTNGGGNGPPPNAGPIVSIATPGANQTVSGTFDVTATVLDQSGAGLWLTAFRLDNPNADAVAIDYFSPWGFSLDTTKLSNGLHTLYVRSEDDLLNVGPDATVTFYVDNTGGGGTV